MGTIETALTEYFVTELNKGINGRIDDAFTLYTDFYNVGKRRKEKVDEEHYGLIKKLHEEWIK